MVASAPVCILCGAHVALSRRDNKWVHVTELPKGSDVHEALPTDEEVWTRTSERAGSLIDAASDMLLHHDSVCPRTSCEFARNLAAALK